MAPRPTEITLSEMERVELERVAALQKAPYRDVQRAKLVLYAADGLSNVEIAARLDMSERNVGRWRRRFAEQRLEACRISRDRVDRAVFPPEQIAEVKAVACEPPGQGAPLSRRSVADVHRLVIERDIGDPSVSTVVRWLRQDAIRPWLYRSWISPTDPDFA